MILNSGLVLRFELATVWSDHVYALALTEHFGHVLSVHCLTEVGDYRDVKDSGSFQAIGILQQHPDFIEEFYGRHGYPASVTDSQTDMQIKAAAAFLERYVPLLAADGDPAAAIQAYNKGVGAYMQGGRNSVYLARWDQSFQRIRGMKP